jgi:hypothetical protein
VVGIEDAGKSSLGDNDIYRIKESIGPEIVKTMGDPRRHDQARKDLGTAISRAVESVKATASDFPTATEENVSKSEVTFVPLKHDDGSCTESVLSAIRVASSREDTVIIVERDGGDLVPLTSTTQTKPAWQDYVAASSTSKEAEGSSAPAAVSSQPETKAAVLLPVVFENSLTSSTLTPSSELHGEYDPHVRSWIIGTTLAELCMRVPAHYLVLIGAKHIPEIQGTMQYFVNEQFGKQVTVKMSGGEALAQQSLLEQSVGAATQQHQGHLQGTTAASSVSHPLTAPPPVPPKKEEETALPKPPAEVATWMRRDERKDEKPALSSSSDASVTKTPRKESGGCCTLL